MYLGTDEARGTGEREVKSSEYYSMDQELNHYCFYQWKRKSQARPHILLHTSVYANANGHAHAHYYNMSRCSPPAPPFSFLYTLLIHSILESNVRDEPMLVRGYTSDKITDERPFKVQLKDSNYDDQESKSPCGTDVP